MQPAQQATAKSTYQVQWIVWGALLLTHGIYGVVVNKVAEQGALASWQQSPLLLPLSCVAMVTLVVTHVLPKMIFRGALRIAKNNGQNLDEKALITSSMTANIVAWALSESITVYGVVLGMECRDIKPFLLFAAVGLVNMLILRPNKDRWLQVAKESGLLQQAWK
ncbi:hypothetical protein [Bdellovibrio sp. HCB337]|uniref:hypothetical protein n=1 Tax=Bdellovibrio sp. HCB337 TaxID=3394358 RepID=UPI0039A4D04F